MKQTQQRRTRITKDLSDNKNDKKHLKGDKAILDLPDVKDIPGQEHVRPLPPGEMADTTISSADEEALDLLNTGDEEIVDQTSNVTAQERELLQQTSESTFSAEELDIQNAAVDNTDEDGTPLNERTNRTGSDLDVPGSEDDDTNEEIGEEDEENNSYSRPD
jgi:hypothetical protein